MSDGAHHVERPREREQQAPRLVLGVDMPKKTDDTRCIERVDIATSRSITLTTRSMERRGSASRSIS